MQSNATSRALATAVWPQDVNRVLRNVVLVLAGTAILAISAKIKVPFYPVPMTLQTFAIMAIGAAYGSRLAVATVVAYLAEAAIGLPVLTNTPPEVASLLYFLGPTGGFLIGFIPLAWIVGTAADRGWDRSVPKLFAAMIAADAVTFALGFAWLAWFAHLANGMSGVGPAGAFAGAVVPFVLGDVLKIALASMLIPAVWGVLARKR